MYNPVVFPKPFQSVTTASYPLFIADGGKGHIHAVLMLLLWKISLMWSKNHPSVVFMEKTGRDPLPPQKKKRLLWYYVLL